MAKLLIADDNEEFRLALMEQLQSEFRVFSCGNGRQALALLRQEQPELLVLDLMLPELDGLTVLELAVQEGICPKVLGVTPLISDYVLDSAQRLGVLYLIRPPCAMEAVAARVRDLAQARSGVRNVDSLGKELLYSLGIGTTLDGCTYSLVCLSQLLENPNLTVTKDLYPAVARATGHSQENVERSIRHAIERGWEQGERSLWLQYFPNAKKRPSNSVFLTRMVEQLRCLLE